MSVLASEVAVIPMVHSAAVLQVTVAPVSVIKYVFLLVTAALTFWMFHVFLVSLACMYHSNIYYDMWQQHTFHTHSRLHLVELVRVSNSYNGILTLLSVNELEIAISCLKITSAIAGDSILLVMHTSDLFVEEGMDSTFNSLLHVLLSL